MSGRGAKCSTGWSSAPPPSRPCSGSTSASPRRSSSAAPICPAKPACPTTARAFWAYVDRHAPDEDLGAASFLEQVHRRHFYFGIADGVKADFVLFRQCDAALNAAGGRKTASAYDAIGAAQVAKASFSGMRLLHHLDGRVAIWPMDPLPSPAQRGGRNLHPHLHSQRRPAGQEDPHRRRTRRRARSRSARSPPALDHVPTDHQTDALVTAAGMRAHLADPRAFAPAGLDPRHRAHRGLDVRRHLTIKRRGRRPD